jgi:hypothetical protein
VLLRGSFDALERFYWPSVSTSLVGYELFWKTFIVLMTKRVDPLARDGWIRLRTGLPSDYERLLMANYSIFYNLVVAHAQIALRRKEVAEGRFYHPEAFFFFSRASIENFDDLTERARKLLHDGGIHLRIPGLPDALLHEIKSYRDVFAHRSSLGRGIQHGRGLIPKQAQLPKSKTDPMPLWSQTDAISIAEMVDALDLHAHLWQRLATVHDVQIGQVGRVDHGERRNGSHWRITRATRHAYTLQRLLGGWLLHLA